MVTAGHVPNVVVLAGPNGAGKSTTGPALLRDTFGITEFVNADTIAQGLSAFDPEGVAIDAARVMLTRMHELADEQADFAFETTLSSRTFAPWLADLRKAGYQIHVLFLWLPSEDLAVERVAARVRMGGHDVPEDVVRRRYRSGLRNFLDLYRPLADSWLLYDNSHVTGPRLVAMGSGVQVTQLEDEARWQQIQEESSDGSQDR
ncbi:MAG TPA: zeta toxin family protein [Planctomycetota bacterium]|nr:zeta toxin family protein [Planctomycetota bacterium]